MFTYLGFVVVQWMCFFLQDRLAVTGVVRSYLKTDSSCSRIFSISWRSQDILTHLL